MSGEKKEELEQVESALTEAQQCVLHRKICIEKQGP